MKLVGGLFRRHALARASWEAEKNLIRLAGDWSQAANTAVADLGKQAGVWVDTELATLDRLLRQQLSAAVAFHEALRVLEGMEMLQPA